MTNDEIRALVDTWKRWPQWLHGEFTDKCMAAIETLLAREAELLKKMHPGPRPPIGYPSESAARIKWRHRREFYRSMAAILHPQPAAMAKEKS